MISVALVVTAGAQSIDSIEFHGVPLRPAATTLTILTVSPASLSFTGDATQTSVQGIGIFTVPGGVTFSALASTNTGGGWLTVPAYPAPLSTPFALPVTITAKGLAPGTYTGQVVVNAVGATPSSTTINVSLTVTAVTSPQLSIGQLSAGVNAEVFSLSPGSQPAQGLLTINNAGSGTLSWSAQATSDGSWLTLASNSAGAPASGTATSSSPASLAFTVNPSGVTPGLHRGKITVTDALAGTSQSAAITLLVSSPQPALQLSLTGMTFTAVAGGPSPRDQDLMVYNLGQGPLPFTVQGQTVPAGKNWVPSPSASGGTTSSGAPVQSGISVDSSDLPPGQYYAVMTYSAPNAPNSPQYVEVLINVVQPGQLGSSPSLSTNGVTLAAAAGAAIASQDVTMSNPAGTPMGYSILGYVNGGGGWLSVAPAGGSLDASGSGKFTIQANLAGLTPGVRYGTVQVAFADGSVQTVQVAFTIPAASSVTSSETRGVRPLAGNCKPTQLVPVFQTPGQSGKVQVAQAQTMQVQITDDCQNVLTRANGGAAQITFGNGDAAVNLSDSGNGMWAGTWNPVNTKSGTAVLVVAQGNGPGLAPLLGGAKIQVDVLAVTSTPAAQALAVLNAASSDTQNAGVVAPASYVSVYGTALSDGQGQAGSLPLPGTLANAQLLVNGEAVPLYYINPTQANGVMPQKLPANSTIQLLATRDSTLSVPLPITVTDVQPGIFAQNAEGFGQGSILIAGTATLAAPTGPGQRPAKRGSDYLEIYCTGLGSVQTGNGAPPPGDGIPAPVDPNQLYRTVATPTVTIGGVVSPTVLYSGLAPGLVWVYQIDALVPSSVNTGDAVPVVISIPGVNGPVSSNTVTVAVQ